MGLNAGKIAAPKGGSGERVQQPELEVSNYLSRLVQLVDIGKHHRKKWVDGVGYQADTSKPPVNFIILTYELTTEFMKDKDGNDVEGKPRWIGEELPLYNIDNDKATSSIRYKAFDPAKADAGDWVKQLGKACTVTVAHSKKGKAKVGNVTPPMKGVPVPELANPVKFFDTTDPDLAVFESLPEFIKDKIKNALDYEGSSLQAMLEGGAKPKQEKAEEDLPFTPDVQEVEDEEDGW